MAKQKLKVDTIVDFRDMRVCKTYRKGVEIENPRSFVYPVDGDNVGLSITCNKSSGYGKMLYIEASFYDDAYADAIALDISIGDTIDFKGFYEVDKGDKRTFNKCHVRNAEHVRFTPTKRNAKASEI